MNSQTHYEGPTYPTEAHGSIPSFASYEEEASFWDTHDITDFKQETTPITVSSIRRFSTDDEIQSDSKTNIRL